MRSVKQLRDGAKLERRRADALHKEAQAHRDKADNFTSNGADPKSALRETEAAQHLEERAAQHERTALDLQQEAAAVEQHAVEVERQEQDLQQATQTKLEQLETEKKKLRGE